MNSLGICLLLHPTAETEQAVWLWWRVAGHGHADPVLARACAQPKAREFISITVAWSALYCCVRKEKWLLATADSEVELQT